MMTTVRIKHTGVEEQSSCPICKSPATLLHGRTSEAEAIHIYRCPDCGHQVAVVLYDCPHCRTPFIRGQQIMSVPMHAGSIDNPGAINLDQVEYGFVTSGPKKDGSYFCRYWLKSDISVLRTKSCSEITPGDTLMAVDSVPQRQVEKALARWC